MTSHMKTYTNCYLFERLKIIPLLFVGIMRLRSKSTLMNTPEKGFLVNITIE